MAGLSALSALTLLQSAITFGLHDSLHVELKICLSFGLTLPQSHLHVLGFNFPAPQPPSGGMHSHLHVESSKYEFSPQVNLFLHSHLQVFLLYVVSELQLMYCSLNSISHSHVQVSPHQL